MSGNADPFYQTESGEMGFLIFDTGETLLAGQKNADQRKIFSEISRKWVDKGINMYYCTK